MEEITAKAAEIRADMRVTTDNNFIVAAGAGDFDLNEKKLLYLAITQCQMKDEQFYYYSIPAADFAAMLGVDKVEMYRQARDMTFKLAHAALEIADKDSPNGTAYALFSICEYKDGVIYFQINNEMSKFLLGLKRNFTSMLFRDVIPMRSTYAISIWHLMRSKLQKDGVFFGQQKEFDISIDELRAITGNQNKNRQICHFKSRVLDVAIKEIEKNDLAKIDYVDLKRGRSIYAIHFILSNPFAPKIYEQKN